ncbi:hypothetical protein AB2B41_06115 [Marimonas sp. MJW-29]|uniref:Lipoprotein n=1 Tax=Sulfitobacter sediminis TaxID=3234186 RepID=A0ABV3RM66_9RHOB
MKRFFRTGLLAAAVSLSGTLGASAMSCPEAETAFFEQYQSQPFAKKRDAFMADPMRWDTAASYYMSGASLLMMAEQAGQKVSAKSIDEFLANTVIVDCWRPEDASDDPRLAAMVAHFDKQFPSGRREMLKEKARSLK